MEPARVSSFAQAVKLAEPFSDWWSVPDETSERSEEGTPIDFYYWNTVTNVTTWDRPASRVNDPTSPKWKVLAK